MNTSNTKGKRNLSLEIIRIFALLSIVMVHISAYIVINFKDTAQSEFIIGNIFNGLSRAGVPLFVMLSGALLLNEDKEFQVKKFYQKSLLWMGLLLVGWLLAYGVFYSVILPLSLGTAPTIDAFWNFILTFKGSDYPHLWYMFMVVGLYLLIPVLRLFVCRKNKTYILWMIVGCFAVQFLAKTLDLFCLEQTTNVSTFLGKFHLEPFTGYFGFVLLGWYLMNFELKKTARMILYIVAAVVMVESIIVVQENIGEISGIRGYLYSELTLPPFLYGTAVFTLCLQIFRGKYTEKKWIKEFSNMCFGIYIVHVIYLELFTRVILPYENTSCGVLAYILLSYAAVLLASFLTVLGIGRIPYVKKIFYLK